MNRGIVCAMAVLTVMALATCCVADDETSVGIDVPDDARLIYSYGDTTWYNGSYYCDSDVTFNSRITVQGSVVLYLVSGCKLTINGGINVGDSCSLRIEGDDDGVLIAKASGSDAGIGGNYGSPGGKITINGGEIYAYGGSHGGAGIGDGHQIPSNGSTNLTVVIGGGTIVAEGGLDAAGIGGADTNWVGGGEITITGGTIKATGNTWAAGIGSGYMGNVENITISGGTVTAIGGKDGGAGIGSGPGRSGTQTGSISITGGTVTATGNGGGAGIGGGVRGGSGTISITGGTVTATGNDGGAGIGGGDTSDGSNITISGGTINAIGNDGGAGIGGGGTGKGHDITITGGTVTATGNGGGAGIGGGDTGNGYTITITGGTVTAKSTNGTGIGGGFAGAIIVSSGTVTAEGVPGIGGKSSIGTFITTDSGNAVIITSSISDDYHTTNWRGVIFDGSNGYVYGDSVTIGTDASIPSGKYLTVESGKTLTIPDGVELVMEAGSTLDIQGEVDILPGGTLKIEDKDSFSIGTSGTLSNEGTLEVPGIIVLKSIYYSETEVTGTLTTIPGLNSFIIKPDNFEYYTENSSETNGEYSIIWDLGDPCNAGTYHCDVVVGSEYDTGNGKTLLSSMKTILTVDQAYPGTGDSDDQSEKTILAVVLAVAAMLSTLFIVADRRKS